MEMCTLNLVKAIAISFAQQTASPPKPGVSHVRIVSSGMMNQTLLLFVYGTILVHSICILHERILSKTKQTFLSYWCAKNIGIYCANAKTVGYGPIGNDRSSHKE